MVGKPHTAVRETRPDHGRRRDGTLPARVIGPDVLGRAGDGRVRGAGFAPGVLRASGRAAYLRPYPVPQAALRASATIGAR